MSELQENVAVPDEPGVARSALTGSASPRRLPRLRLGVWLPPLVAFAALAAAWELYAGSHPFVIPSIEDIWTTLSQTLISTGSTFRRRCARSRSAAGPASQPPSCSPC